MAPLVQGYEFRRNRVRQHFEVFVEGEMLPLVGDSSILNKTLKNNLNSYLERLGYETTEDRADYRLNLKYKTKRQDKEALYGSVGYSFASGLYTDVYTGKGMGAYSGLGARVALAVSEAALQAYVERKPEEKVVGLFGTITSYIHSISVEIENQGGDLIWKGESTWDSGSLNLEREILPAFQLILTQLPAEYKTPEVKKVQEEKAGNYSQLNIRGKWFVSPALPYRTQFQYSRMQRRGSLPAGRIEDVKALAAYVDLIKTAEFALPKGRGDYSDPLEDALWSRVQLGRAYYLMPGQEKINVLIELSGRDEGYQVDRARIASDDEYREYEQNMQEWKEALKDYFKVYVEK